MNRPCAKALIGPIAHRGLHDAANGIIENSAEAFDAAIAAGVGIECDVRPARGGWPMVFHDQTLERLMAATGSVGDRAPANLRSLDYLAPFGAVRAPMMALDDALARVNGRVPVLVEIKSEWAPADPAFLQAIAGLLTAYAGPIGVMSFDPSVIRAMALLAAKVPRGLVSGSYRSQAGDTWWADQLSPERAWDLRCLSELDIVEASFVAYEVAALPSVETQAARQRGLPVFTWTVRTTADWATPRAHADAAIFEGERPA
jgi:glycerophosphoryl diester phosphodiesterase